MIIRDFEEFCKSKGLKGRNAMKRSKLLPILLLMLTSLALAQSAPSGQRAQRHQQMQAMCKEHIAAMKADAQKMHSAFDKMKANVASIAMPMKGTLASEYGHVADHGGPPRPDAETHGRCPGQRHGMRDDDGRHGNGRRHEPDDASPDRTQAAVAGNQS